MEKEEYQEHKEEDSMSKFNSASLQNQRLHNIWVEINKYRASSQNSKWNANLDTIWCELAGDVKKDSQEDIDFKKINKSLSEVGQVINWQATEGFKKIPKELIKKKSNQYKELMEKEIFLRRLQNKQGKGTSYKDNSSDYLDG